jgi:hypothetical protein
MDLSAIFEIITAVAVTLGILFGILQLRHYHLSRNRDAALLLINSFQTSDFVQGIQNIQDLPNGLTRDEIEKSVGGEIKTIHLVMSTWERIGILVFKRELSMDMVDDFYRNSIIFSWQRLEKYVIDTRDRLQNESSFEWFQWLAERMIDREKAKSAIPAYVAHIDWK